jgi:dipeptide/tripeptide permease
MASASDAPVDVSASEQDDKTYTVSSKDVSLMLSVVNVVSARGGFKPNEFKLVGELYEKLVEMTKEEKK